MKMKKMMKRIVAGFVGITMAAGVFFGHTISNVQDVQADTRVFTEITERFSAAENKQIRILEISTTKDVYDTQYAGGGTVSRKINQNAELGYFMPYNAADPVVAGYRAGDADAASTPAYMGFASRGGKYGNPAAGMDGQGGENAYVDMLLKYRQYGLVKSLRADSGWNTAVGEYPIYSRGATFSRANSGTTGYKIASDEFVLGVYTKSTGGAYQLAEGYDIDESGRICKVEEVPDVSNPSVSEGTVSGDDTGNVKMVLTPVPDTDIDMSVPGLPRSATTGDPYITAVEDGESGNLTFTVTTTPTDKKQYYGYSVEPLWYSPMGAETSRSKNSGWFAEYVLGSYRKYADVDLKYDVKYAGDVTPEDTKNYDLIYISGTDAEFSANDLRQDTVKALYENTINDHQAIIMDFDGYSQDSDTNYDKLAALLWQESQSDLLTEDSDILKEDMSSGTASVVLNIDLLTGDALNALKGRMLTENANFMNKTHGNFVVGNVYVYDHHADDFNGSKLEIDAEDSFATGDFHTPYNDIVVNAGFNNVLQYIDTTNRNSLTGGMANEVTPAVVIQYILVSDGIPLTVMKTALNVLEIESGPTYLYNTGWGSEEYEDLPQEFQKNREEFIQEYLTDYYQTEEMKKYISFTSLTIPQFNAMNDDLIETYDIIYIGDEMYKQYGPTKGENFFNIYTNSYDYYNYYAGSPPPRNDAFLCPMVDSYTWDKEKKVYGDGNAPVKVRLPNYFDDNMDCMIYYNIGDWHESADWEQQWRGMSRFNGFLKDESANGVYPVLLRWSGRDFTKDKLAKMKSFLNAGALVIVAEDLYGSPNGQTTPVVNPTYVQGGDNGRVDNSSNLYEFLMYGAGYVWDKTTGEYLTKTENESARVYSNMVSAADISRGIVDKASLNQYIAAFKLELLLSQRPAEYGYGNHTADGLTNVIDPDTVVYLNTKNDNGTRILKYVFTINDETSLLSGEEGAFGTQYFCRLYIDINNDGKYSKTTEDISDIRIVDTAGNEPERDKDNDHYLLQSGVEYTLTREIADEYCGILKWKLAVESKYSSTIHASEEGYTMVKNETGQKKIIKVLQITKHDENNQPSTLNLMRALYNERTRVRNQQQNGGGINHDNWGRYLNDLPDYELEIRTLDIRQFEQDFENRYQNNNPNGLSAEEFAMQVYFPEFEIKSPNVTTDINGTVYDYSNETVVTGVNMLVLGFGDDITPFDSYPAISAVKAFMAAGKPVLLAHDFIHFTSEYKQTRILREIAGMDKYGVSQRLVPIEGAAGASNDVETAMFVNRWLENGAESTQGYDYLHSGLTYTRTNGDDKEKLALIEGTDKEVAYRPGTMRQATARETHGLSFELMERYSSSRADSRGYAINDFYNRMAAPAAYTHWESDQWWPNYNEIHKLNDGQITQYPYILPQSFIVNVTHGQYFELDLTSDADDDGEADVVVWYAMGSFMDGPNGNRITMTAADRWTGGINKYDDQIGISVDPANAYYIYNKGNLTYTGTGHEWMEDAPEAQIQLFVNVLLASFQAGNTAPTGNFYDKADINASPISSVVVPYDGNVTKPEAGETGVDSGVTKKAESDEYAYKFVDPNIPDSGIDRNADGTIVYFRIDDKNLVRGTKKIAVGYYLTVDETPGTEVTIKDTDQKRTVRALEIGEEKSVNVIDISDHINTYKVTNNIVATEAMGKDGLTESGRKCVADVDSGLTYAIYLPMTYLNDNASFTIYLEAQTTVTSVTTLGVETQDKTEKIYIPLTVVKADLLDLD